jgi:hypothetical protein
LANVKQAACSVDEFTTIIEDLLEQVEQTHGIMRIVLLIDEIDIFIHVPWAEVLFSLLRSIISEGPLRDEIRYVLGGFISGDRVKRSWFALLQYVEAFFSGKHG